MLESARVGESRCGEVFWGVVEVKGDVGMCGVG